MADRYSVCSRCGRYRFTLPRNGKNYCEECAMQLKNESRSKVYPPTVLTYVILGVFFFIFVYRVTCHVLYGDPIMPDLIPTSTPAVTASPTATSPPEDVVSWVSYFSERGAGDDISFLSVEEASRSGELILVVKFFMNPMSKGKHYRISAAQTIMQVVEDIRDAGYHGNYDSVNFLFYGGFIDKHGNRNENLGIRAWYTSKDIALLNFDYFESSLYSNPDAIIKAADDYIIHPAYQD